MEHTYNILYTNKCCCLGSKEERDFFQMYQIRLTNIQTIVSTIDKDVNDSYGDNNIWINES